MCGRYTLAVPAGELVETFDVPALQFDWLPRYNIAPGQLVPVLAEDSRGRRIGLLEWGFVPAWKDEPGRPMINARAETVASKPTFREAFARRRCLVPADGFFEWHERRPYWIHPREGGLVCFAGVWESWRRPGREPRHTLAILTTAANEDVQALHDRMPVVIAAADRSVWLSGGGAGDRHEDLQKLLRPATPGTFVHHEVSKRVNRTAEDDAELIAPL